MPIDSTIAVVTPENISFRYELAGPFRRLPAFIIDIAIRFVVWVLMLLVMALTGVLGQAGAALGITLWLLMWFLLEWFYGGLLEALWNGQTVGKRLLGLRVLSVDGQPINGIQAVLRNILRLADLMPLIPASVWVAQAGGWAIPTGLAGLLVPVLNRRCQRLGDLACGTIVVVERREWLVSASRFDDPSVLRLVAELPVSFQVDHALSQALASYVERRRYLAPGRRTEIASHLGLPLRQHLRGWEDTDDDRLLCALYCRTFITPQDGTWDHHAGVAGRTGDSASQMQPSEEV